MQRVSINRDDLVEAYAASSPEPRFYLNRERGVIMLVSEETRTMREALDEDADGEGKNNAAEVLDEADVPDWMRQALHVAREVEHGYGERYISIGRVCRFLSGCSPLTLEREH